MGRPKRYATESEKQAAYRKRKKDLSGGVESRHARDESPRMGANRIDKDQGQPSASGSSAPPAQNNLPVPVLAEPSAEKSEFDDGEARESTTSVERLKGETPTTGCFRKTDSRGGQSFSYDKKKYPNRGAWETAVGRVERVVRYAQMFPNLIGSDDLKFQSLDWQYQNEGLKAPTS